MFLIGQAHETAMKEVVSKYSTLLEVAKSKLASGKCIGWNSDKSMIGRSFENIDIFLVYS